MMDKKKVLRVVAVCFLGSIIGAAVGLEIKTISWLLGMLVGAAVGGAAGWLIYEPAKTWTGLKYGWKAAQVAWGAGKRKRNAEKEIWKEVWIEMTYVTLILIFFLLDLGLTLGIAEFFAYLPQQIPIDKVIIDMGLAVALGAMMIGMPVFVGIMSESSANWRKALAEGKGEEKRTERKKVFDFFNRRLNPLMLYGYWFPRGVWELLRLLPGAVSDLGLLLARLVVCFILLIKEFVLYVHSDEHLVVLVDCAIGSMIGVAAGNWLIGGITGAAAGFLNILLVVPRVQLHLARTRE